MNDIQRLEHESVIAYRQRMLVELVQMDKSDFSSALAIVLQVCSIALEAERTEFWWFTDNGQSIVCEMLYRADLQKLDESGCGLRLHREHYPEYFDELVRYRSVIAHDTGWHPATRRLNEDYLKLHHITSLLDVAVWFNRQFVGVLCIENTGKARRWTPEEEMFASFAASMISLVLETSTHKRKEQEYRKQEELYRYIIENSTDGIYRTDTRGRFIFANNAATQLLGYTVQDILGKPYHKFIHPKYRLEALRLYKQQAEERTESTYFEFPTLRKDGSEIWLGQNVQLVIEHEKIVGFQAVVRNITQRKLAEEEILKALEKERQLSELKSRFVTMVLHELRTPLTGISLSTEILQRYANKIDEQQKDKSYKKIFENVKRLVGLMDGILLLSETEASKLTFRPGRIALEEFCRNLLIDIVPDGQIYQQIHLHIESCDTFIMGDEILLRHILGHLILNAIKYSTTTVDIRFSVLCRGDFTVFTIADKGIGIPEDDLPLIFNTFHRAKNAAETIPGTGVGLSVVKQCVTMHQGTIEVESQESKGTVFTIIIPATYNSAPEHSDYGKNTTVVNPMVSTAG